jgi:hypothetical protein
MVAVIDEFLASIYRSGAYRTAAYRDTGRRWALQLPFDYQSNPHSCTPVGYSIYNLSSTCGDMDVIELSRPG